MSFTGRHILQLKSISILPFLPVLKGYKWSFLKADLMAGITVAVFAVPQVMAYAMLANVPPVYGLYSAILIAIVAALWGSSEWVNSGPTNSASLLTAAALLPFMNEATHLEILFAFTLLVGLFRLLMGLMRMGRLLHYVPESAFIGFTVGAGILIALGQLHHLLGVSSSSHRWFVKRMFDVSLQIGDLNWISFCIGLATFGIMLSLDKFNRKFPIALLAISLSAGVVYILPEKFFVITVKNVEPITASIPTFKLPMIHWETILSLIPGAFAVAVIGLIEAVSIGQVLSLKRGKTLNFNQEFVGQGISHVAGSFFQCIPGSGSFSRSALIYESGGITRFANVFFGGATALALLYIPNLLNLIPVCALSGLLLYIAYKLIDIHKIKRVWKTSREDSFVLWITFFVTVFIRIEYGIYVGIILSALLFLNRASDLQLFELIPQSKGPFQEKKYALWDDHEPSALVTLMVRGDLFYGKAHELRDALKAIVQHQKPEIILLRTRRAFSIDYSCWSALFDFARAFKEQGGKLFLCGVRPDYEKIIKEAEMEQVLPNHQIIPLDATQLSDTKHAAKYALKALSRDAKLSLPWEKFSKDLGSQA